MSRWANKKSRDNAKQPSQSSKKKGACDWCGATAPNGAKLCIDKGDGRAYCATCWESYYGSAPPGSQEPALSTREAVAEEPAPGSSQAVVEEPALSTREAVAEEPAPRRSQAVAEEAFATSSSAVAAPLASNTACSPAVVATARFAREVEELRARWQAQQEEGLQRCEEAVMQQQEELEALSAIYGEGLEVLTSEGEQPVVLRLELATEPEGGAAEIFVSTAEGEVPAGRVENLPPLVLRCALPPLYPLDEAPVFLLEAEHLDREGSLVEWESSLRDLAADRVGEPVLFEWATALQERLQLSGRLSLRGGQGVDAMEVALRLLAHDKSIRDDRRRLETQRCPMCFDDMPGSRGLFLSCGHFGCRDCLGQMVQLHMSESDITGLRCPFADCRESFSLEALRELGVDSSALERWEELSLRRCLDQMKDIVDCPRCITEHDGRRTPCIIEEDNMAQCECCGFVFCGRCRGIYHPGVDCASVMGDRMEALEARAAKSGPDGEAARAELLTLRHLQRTTKSCPKCKMAIEKTEGCSKVICQNCKAYFCWRCGKEISGYDHFATSECRLFDDEEIRRWNQNWRQQVDKAQARAHEARFLAQFVDPAEMWQRARDCPRCKTQVLKEGKNNHMRCHSCLTAFCGRCLEVLPKNRGGEHFNKFRICPQHSDD